ncbi:hypothetical protein PGIGA_G00082420 [Pangasianodon gigas]|uniref:Uncharacterized protein n=1 Tax=Pangasianodon gigas TaxID=30993 RepID=A0ACC5XB65_PANGG|nr:hypothetical protein [Pangasianodon gigas]
MNLWYQPARLKKLCSALISCCSGKSGAMWKNISSLPSEKTENDTVIKQFPNTTVSEVRALIRRKGNNELYSEKNDPPLEG